jgi:hypothetical protein
MEWIVTISLFVLLAGIALSVIEEWPKQGLTDTSFLTLGLWTAGQGGLLYLAWLQQYLVLSVLLASGIMLALWAVGAKLYCRRHYWKRGIPPQVKGKGFS